MAVLFQRDAVAPSARRQNSVATESKTYFISNVTILPRGTPRSIVHVDSSQRWNVVWKWKLSIALDDEEKN